MNKLPFLTVVLVGMSLMGLVASDEILAQEKFPARSIKIIVAYPAGGSSDLITRAIQPQMSNILKQPVVVENKSGAGGAIGYTEVAGEAPDGYTVGWVGPSIVMAAYTGSPDVTYRNYEPVILVGNTPGCIAVGSDAPWKTLKEFLDHARANPGKVRIANSGFGASPHLRALGLELLAGVKFTHVPYKGSNPATMGLVGGHVEATTPSLPDVSQLAKAGRLRILALTANERSTIMPDVPSIKELGMEFDNGSWYGYVVPKKTPENRIRVLHDAMKGAMDRPDFIEAMRNQVIMVKYLGPRDFGKFLESEEKQWLRLLNAAGMTKVR